MSLLFAEFIRKLQVYLSRIPLSGMEVERVTVGRREDTLCSTRTWGGCLCSTAMSLAERKKVERETEPEIVDRECSSSDCMVLGGFGVEWGRRRRNDEGDEKFSSGILRHRARVSCGLACGISSAQLTADNCGGTATIIIKNLTPFIP